MTLQLALLPNKRLKLGFTSLNAGSLLPTALNKSIQQLSVQEKGGMVIASKDYLRAKTANSLTQFWSGGHGWQDGAADFFKEATGIAPEFLPQVGAWRLLQGCMNAGPHEKMLLIKSGEWRVVWQHVVFPFLN